MKAIIFDFDGVLHNTFECLHKLHCDTLEILTPNELKEKVFNGNPREYFKKFTNKQQTNFEEAWKKHYQDLRIKQRTKDELNILCKKYLLFVNSSNTELNLNKYMENNGLLNIFQKIYGVETHISKVAKFRILLKEANLKAEDCIFVTDTLGDILEANEVKIKTLAVDFGFHEKEKLQKGSPFKIISNFTDIRVIVGEFKNEKK